MIHVTIHPWVRQFTPILADAARCARHAIGSRWQAEFKTEAAKMVVQTQRPIAEVAREIHVNLGILGNWVTRYRADHAGEEPPLSITERARLLELEKEVRELRMKANFLGKTAAFFAQESR